MANDISGEEISKLWSEGSYVKMADACRSNLKSNPNSWYDHIQLALALNKLGKDEEAYSVCRDLVSLVGGTDNLPPPMRQSMKNIGFNA